MRLLNAMDEVTLRMATKVAVGFASREVKI